LPSDFNLKILHSLTFSRESLFHMRFDISLNNEILFGYPCALLSCVALKMSSVGGDGKEAEVLRARVALLV